MSYGDANSVRATARRAVRCNDVSSRSRAGSSHRPVLPPMGNESKARRLRDRAQRRVGVDSGHRATRPADQRHGSSRRLRQARIFPASSSAMARARFDPGGSQRRRQQLAQTPTVLTEALQGIVSADDLAHPWPSHPTARLRCGRRPGSADMCIGRRCATAITPANCSTYGEAGYTPPRPRRYLSTFRAGRGYSDGATLQGHALMAHLVRRGWVCLSLEYRTSPQHRWPRQMTDVKAAIAWARANVAQFGGDPDFIVAAGCSAGGHLATLAGTDRQRPCSGKPIYPLTPTHPSMPSSACTACTTGRTAPLRSAPISWNSLSALSSSARRFAIPRCSARRRR